MSAPDPAHSSRPTEKRLPDNTVHFLQRSDRWGNRFALWVLAALCFSIPPIFSSLADLRMNNAVDQWLPSDDPQMQTLEWFSREFGQEDVILVSWQGSSWDDPRVTEFAAELAATDGDDAARDVNAGIVKVTTPQGLFEEMRRNGVKEGPARERLQGVLVGADADGPIAVSVQVNEKQASPQQILTRIRTAAVEVGIPEEAIHLGGGLVGRGELDRSVATSSWNAEAPWWLPWKKSPTLASMAAGVLLAFVMLRSIRLAVMVLAVSGFTAIATLALIPLLGSTLNMVLVVLPTLVMVLTLSGAIHMTNYWKHAAIADPRTAVSNAINMAAQPCFLAVLTTAIGMITLMTSTLKPVRDFGLFSAIGVMLSLGMILWGLPTLLLLWTPRRIYISSTDSHFWESLGRWLARHRKLAGWGSVAATLAATAGLYWFQTETKVIRFFPEDSRIVKDYEFLERQLAGINPINVVVAFGPEALEETNTLDRMELVRQVEAELRQQPEISGALSLADFRPTLEEPPASAAFLQKARYLRTAHELEKVIHDEESDASTLVQAAEQPLTLSSAIAEPLVQAGDEIWRIKLNSRALTEADYGPLVDDLEQRTAAVLQGTPGAKALVTGMVPLFLRTQEALLESLIWSFGLAFLLIEGILIVLLRGFRAGTLAMLPNVFPVLGVFGLVAWAGIGVDIGSMVTASVALGIAIDGTVHLLTWFEDGIRRGMTRDEAIAQSLGHCGPPMWQTSVIIACGLLMLMGADLLLISRFGWLMTALVMAALAFDVIYLPTLLAGSLGKLIERRVQREMAEAPPADGLVSLPVHPSGSTADSARRGIA